MTGPDWLAPGLAALMLLIAGFCAVRLVLRRTHARHLDPGSDALHVLMGVAMAGMFEPRLSPVPAGVWLTVFGAAVAWFGWLAVSGRRARRPAGQLCAHPAAHAVECAAMVYMAWYARPAAGSQAPAMPGMSMSAAANPALALVFALFMLGYVLWTTDQLSTAAHARAGAVPGPGDSGSALAASGQGATMRVPASQAPSQALSGNAIAAVISAPELAASCQIAMGVAMGYMLVTML